MPPSSTRRRLPLAGAAVAVVLFCAMGLVRGTTSLRVGRRELPTLPMTVAAIGDDRLQGTVIALDGSPVVDGDVAIIDAIARQEARTDGVGAFSLPRRPIGPARVEVTAAGFGKLSLPSMLVLHPLVLSLAPTVVVDGVVVDAANGRGVKAQLFVANGCSPQVRIASPLDERKVTETCSRLLATEDDGSFQLVLDERCRGGTAFASTHESTDFQVTGTRPLRVAMTRSVPRCLRVVDEAGRPVVGARVRDAVGYARPGEAFLVLDQGEATAPEVQLRGAYASAPGFVTMLLDQDRNPTPGAPWVVTMKRSRTVRGQVRGPEGANVGEAWLVASFRLPEHPHRATIAWERPDAEGRFVLEVPQAATDLSIEILHPRWEALPVRVQREGTQDNGNHDEGTISIELRPGNPLKLRGVAPLVPSEVGTLALRFRSPIFATRWAVLDPDTLSTIPEISVARGSVEGWTAHGHAVHLERRPLNLHRTRILTGRVTDGADRPVPGAMVTAIESGAIQDDPPLAFTDPHGRFQVPACMDLCKLFAVHPHQGVGAVSTDAKDDYHLVLTPR